MEFRQLEYFLMVSQVKSFTRAAERLYVSQPAITNAIRSLEDELGVQLFDRGQKQALLTAEGKVFYNHVENVMRDVSKTISEISSLKNLNTGILTLGVVSIAGVNCITRLLANFQKIYPNIQLTLIEDNVPAIHKSLIEDKSDLGIIIEGETYPGIESFSIGNQELLVCFPKSHQFSLQNSIDLTELVAEPLILLKNNSLLRRRIIEEFEQINTLPQIKIESNHIQTIKSMIAHHVGISILPADLCRDDLALLSRPLTNPIIITLAIARKKNKYLSHATRALLELATKNYYNEK